MLIHIIPKMSINNQNLAFDAKLVDIKSDELDLYLEGGKDVTQRHPYPNKQYEVVCRKIGKKAINGILLSTDKAVNQFTVMTRWHLTGMNRTLEHVVHYRILDHEHDAVSGNMILWGAMSESLGGWENREPEIYQNNAPIHVMPCMGIRPRGMPDNPFVVDTLDKDGIIERREQTFYMPSIESGRLFMDVKGDDPFFSRNPGREQAIEVHPSPEAMEKPDDRPVTGCQAYAQWVFQEIIDKANELKQKGEGMQAMRSLDIQGKGKGLIETADEIKRMAYYLEDGANQYE